MSTPQTPAPGSQAALMAMRMATPSVSRAGSPSLAAVVPAPLQEMAAFVGKHREFTNLMVAETPALLTGALKSLLRIPSMLDFDNKRRYFAAELRRRFRPRGTRGTWHMHLRRADIIEGMFHHMMRTSPDTFRRAKMHVEFEGEEGVDAGGVTRDFFSHASKQLFNPDYALFSHADADRTTLQPNRHSFINPNHLSYFELVGRFVGKALFEGVLLDAYFTRALYKFMLGVPVAFRDMEAIDKDFYTSLDWMLRNDITGVLDLTFSVDEERFGTTEPVDLIAGGQNIAVTEQSKKEYVRLVSERRMIGSVAAQLGAIKRGVLHVIPSDLLKLFSAAELELLISGLHDVDVADWRRNSVYDGGYTATSDQVMWFWRALQNMTNEQRAQVLMFTTGSSKVPHGGFSALQGCVTVILPPPGLVSPPSLLHHHSMHGPTAFKIVPAQGAGLVTAHTCANTLDLPKVRVPAPAPRGRPLTRFAVRNVRAAPRAAALLRHRDGRLWYHLDANSRYP